MINLPTSQEPLPEHIHMYLYIHVCFVFIYIYIYILLNYITLHDILFYYTILDHVMLDR